MPTPNFNLPLIDGASPISIVHDMNALATAADAAMGTLATQGDISGIKTQVTNANKVATTAQAEAEKARGAAESASEAAATANATANTAKGSADNANAAVTALKTQTDKIESQVYFQPMERHPKNPFPANTWTGRRSNNYSQFQINGFIGVKPNGGQGYASHDAIVAAKTVIPGTTAAYGIPLFIVGKQPTSVIDINSGLFFRTENSSDPYSYNAAYICNIYIGTDGVAYLTTENALDRDNSICYGNCNTGIWSF